jgi:hypothetical protein
VKRNHCFVLAFANRKPSGDDETILKNCEDLVDLVEKSVKAAFSGERKTWLVSVAPGGVMVAIKAEIADPAEKLLSDYKQYAELCGMATCCAVTFGQLDVVVEPWLSGNFGGAPAIIAARILSQLGAGELGIARVKDAQFFSGLVSEMLETMIPGKHPGEEFPVYIDRRYFVCHSTPTGSNSAPTPTDNGRSAASTDGPTAAGCFGPERRLHLMIEHGAALREFLVPPDILIADFLKDGLDTSDGLWIDPTSVSDEGTGPRRRLLDPSKSLQDEGIVSGAWLRLGESDGERNMKNEHPLRDLET